MRLRLPSRVLVLLVALAALPAVAEASGRRRTRPGLPAVTGAATPKSDEAVQAALDSTPAGGIVRLPYGVYRTAIVVDRPLTLVAHPRGTTLDSRSLGRPAIEVLEGVAGVVVDGVRIAGSDVDGIHAHDGADRLRVVRGYVERCG